MAVDVEIYYAIWAGPADIFRIPGIGRRVLARRGASRRSAPPLWPPGASVSPGCCPAGRREGEFWAHGGESIWGNATKYGEFQVGVAKFRRTADARRLPSLSVSFRAAPLPVRQFPNSPPSLPCWLVGAGGFGGGVERGKYLEFRGIAQ